MGIAKRIEVTSLSMPRLILNEDINVYFVHFMSIPLIHSHALCPFAMSQMALTHCAQEKISIER